MLCIQPFRVVALAAVMAIPVSSFAGARDEGKHFLERGEYQSALQSYERAIAASPEDPSQRHGLGLALVGLLRYGDAAEAFDRAVALDPEATPSWLELLIVSAQIGERDRALRALTALRPDALDDVPLSDRLRAARALRKVGALSEAREALPKQTPLSPETQRERALIAAAEGECLSALDAFSLAAPSAELELEHGRCLDDVGRTREAIAHYRRALELDPRLGSARYRLGTALLRSGAASEGRSLLAEYERFRQWQRRTKLLLAMVSSGTLEAADSREKLRELVDLYLQGGALDDAATLIATGLAEDPDDADLRTARAQWQIATGDAGGARATLDALLARDSPPANALWLSARQKLGEGRVEEAVAEYERLAAKEPETPALALKELATAYAMSGNLEAAAAHFDKAIARDGNLVEARADYGLVLESMGEAVAAEAQYRAALAIAPDLIAALQGLGSLLLAKGDLEPAEALFRKSVELAPDVAELRVNLALVLRRLGRDDEAEEHLRLARGPKE